MEGVKKTRSSEDEATPALTDDLEDSDSDSVGVTAMSILQHLLPTAEHLRNYRTRVTKYSPQEDRTQHSLEDSDSYSASSKRAVSMLRMGKRRVGMLRMGRPQQPEDDADTDAVRRAVGMLRMGRGGDEQDKRAVSMLRMGRGGLEEYQMEDLFVYLMNKSCKKCCTTSRHLVDLL